MTEQLEKYGLFGRIAISYQLSPLVEVCFFWVCFQPKDLNSLQTLS